MCSECWKEYGSPQIRNADVELAVKSIKNVYDHDGMGGNLHCIVDDFNLEDEFFDKYEIYNSDTTNAQELEERICFDLLKSMTLEERASAMALYHYGEFPE